MRSTVTEVLEELVVLDLELLPVGELEAFKELLVLALDELEQLGLMKEVELLEELEALEELLVLALDVLGQLGLMEEDEVLEELEEVEDRGAVKKDLMPLYFFR